MALSEEILDYRIKVNEICDMVRLLTVHSVSVVMVASSAYLILDS